MYCTHLSYPEGDFDNTPSWRPTSRGRKRLETTRRYSLATERDGEAAMESLRVEY
jgi:hypothetical protein